MNPTERMQASFQFFQVNSIDCKERAITLQDFKNKSKIPFCHFYYDCMEVGNYLINSEESNSSKKLYLTQKGVSASMEIASKFQDSLKLSENYAMKVMKFKFPEAWKWTLDRLKENHGDETKLVEYINNLKDKSSNVVIVTTKPASTQTQSTQVRVQEVETSLSIALSLQIENMFKERIELEDSYKSKISTLEGAIIKSSKAYEDLQKVVSSQDDQIEQQDYELSTLRENDPEKLMSTIIELRKLNIKLNNKNNQLTEKVNGFKQELENKSSALKSELDDITVQKEVTELEVDGYILQIEQLKAEALESWTVNQSKIEILVNKVNSLTNDLEEALDEIKRLDTLVIELESKAQLDEAVYQG